MKQEETLINGWFLLAITLIAAIFSFHYIPEPDMWWHLAFGRWMVDHHQLLRKDIFTYTINGIPWIYNGWLGAIIMYMCYAVLGSFGLMLMKFVSLWLTLFITAKTCVVRRGLQVWLIPILFFGAWALFPRTLIRPSILVMPLFAWVVYLLHRKERVEDNWIWFIPLITAVWINIHASAVILIPLLIAYYVGLLLDTRFRLAGWLHRRYLMLIVTTAVMLLANPYGEKLPLLSLHVTQKPLFHMVYEWRPIWDVLVRWHTAAWIAALFAIGFLLMMGIRYSRCWWRWLLPALMLLLMASKHIRFTGMFIIFVIPLLWDVVSEYIRNWPRIFYQVMCAVLTGVVVVLSITGLPKYLYGKQWHPITLKVNHMEAPETAMAVVEELAPSGHIFHDISHAGFMAWRLPPKHKLFIDGRLELHYPQNFLLHVMAKSLPRVFKYVVDRYDIQVVLWPTQDNQLPLYQYLETDPGWRMVYRDGKATVFVRR